jgi:hypothetical protein
MLRGYLSRFFVPAFVASAKQEPQRNSTGAQSTGGGQSYGGQTSGNDGGSTYDDDSIPF